jgi:hypothetical protein
MTNPEAYLVTTDRAGWEGFALQKRSLMFQSMLGMHHHIHARDWSFFSGLVPLFGHCTGGEQDRFYPFRDLRIGNSKAARQLGPRYDRNSAQAVTREPTFSPITTRWMLPRVLRLKISIGRLFS